MIRGLEHVCYEQRLGDCSASKREASCETSLQTSSTQNGLIKRGRITFYMDIQ